MLDGLTLNALIRELKRQITGARIDRILQPEKDELHIVLRTNTADDYRLLLSGSSNNSRVHLTTHHKPNPSSPPMFCMLLRKRLIGARILDVRQYQTERILELILGTRDEIGIEHQMILRAEIMGRHSNIILTDDHNIIVDAVKRINEEKSRVREILPGLSYIYPPEQNKIDPKTINVQNIYTLLEKEERTLPTVLSASIMGVSSASAQEITANSTLDATAPLIRYEHKEIARAAQCIKECIDRILQGPVTPVLIYPPEKDIPKDFLPFSSTVYPKQWCRSADSLSAAMDEFYYRRDLSERMQQASSSMTQNLKRQIERCRRKLDKLQEMLTQAKGLETYKLYGELLTSNLYQIEKGAASIHLHNWYAPEEEWVEIPLDPSISASANAQRYYKKYQKAKTALDQVSSQQNETLQELSYLEGQMLNIESCDHVNELEEIREELIREGYISPSKHKKSGQSSNSRPSSPLHFRSSDGYDIFVGRNNLQNDYLTMKMANADDVWMHTKDIPGSHVIIRRKKGSVSDTALSQGAMLAAWYSKAKQSSNVAVDYTPRRHVKKPGGAKPGFVIYVTNKTLYVTPLAPEIAAMTRITDQ